MEHGKVYQRATRFGAAALLLLCGSVLAAYLPWPLAPDHGIMGLVGRVWARGGVPYRDSFDTKGPLAYAFFAVVERLFGPSELALRATDAALLAAGAIAFGLTLRRLVGREVAWGTAALWTCLVPTLGYENTMQPDGWVSLATAPAILACWLRPTALAPAALLGAVTGGAAMVKPIFLAYAAIPPCVALLAGAGRRAIAAQAAVAAGAALAVVLAVCGWFAAHGAAGALFAAYVQYNRKVYWGAENQGVMGVLRGVWEFWLWTGGRFLVPVAVAGAVTLRRRDPRLAVLVIGWGCGSAVLVALQARFFAYQWLVVLPPLCLLAALGMSEIAASLARVLRSATLRWALPAHLAAASVSAAALIVILERDLQDVGRATLLVTGARDRAWFDERFTREPFYKDESNVHRRAAAWLESNVPPGGSVGLWAFNPVAVWLSGRSVAGPVFGWPLIVGEGTPERERFRREFLRALRRDPPAAFVIDEAWEKSWNLDASIARFPELCAFIQGYEEAAQIGGLRLLTRRRRPGAAPVEARPGCAEQAAGLAPDRR